MEPGDKFKARTADNSIVSEPSSVETFEFIKYGRKIKNDRFIFAYKVNKGEHALRELGEKYKVSLAESQII